MIASPLRTIEVQARASTKGSDVEETDLARLILRAMSLPARPGPAHAAHLAALRKLADRLAASRLQLAVLGQFKRGKSSLLNALLGHAVMPVGVLPVTSIPVFIAGADTLLLKVTHRNGNVEELHPTDDAGLRDALGASVTEDNNPHNRLEIARVEVALPAPLLSEGVVLIDTPGVGSTFLHNTKEAEAALAECDAALFVVSPDPPITELELAYLERIRKVAASLVVVLNKIDLLDAEERATSLSFLRRVLFEQAGLTDEVPIFALSARTAGGLAPLERYLVDVLAKEKARILRPAIAAKAESHVGAMRLETQIALNSLRMPLADLERRMAIFDRSIGNIADEQRDTHDRIAGDRGRMLAGLDARAAEIEARALRLLLQELAERGESARLAARAAAHFEQVHEEVRREMQQLVGEISAAHWRRADTLAEAVRRAAAELMEVRPAPALTSEPLPLDHAPFWVMSGRTESFGEISLGAASRLLPQRLRRRQLRRRMEAEITAIVKRNVENLRWATRQAVEDALRRLAADIDAYLSAVHAATRGAMQAALERRRQHAETSDPEIEEEERTAQSLAGLESALRDITGREV